jgi:hypothetical protein
MESTVVQRNQGIVSIDHKNTFENTLSDEDSSCVKLTDISFDMRKYLVPTVNSVNDSSTMLALNSLLSAKKEERKKLPVK